MSGNGAERKCWHGSLPAAIGCITENMLVTSFSQADPQADIHCRRNVRGTSERHVGNSKAEPVELASARTASLQGIGHAEVA
jgi:hypothetical protein